MTDLNSRLHGARQIGQQVDGPREVLSRCQKRLAEEEAAKVEGDKTIIKEMADIASYQAQLTHSLSHLWRFAKQIDWSTTVARKHSLSLSLSLFDRQAHEGERQRRHRGSGTILAQAAGSGTLDSSIDMTDVASRGRKHEGGPDWPQNTNKVRYTTKTLVEEAPQLEDPKGRRRGGPSDF